MRSGRAVAEQISGYQPFLRYFFYQKLMFINMPLPILFFLGGFGTMDELFEALTSRVKSFDHSVRLRVLERPF